MAKHDANRLTPVGDGRFCKRVRGVLYHFGRGGDADLALREWLKVKDDLLAGRKVRREAPGRPRLLTIELVQNAFLAAWERRVRDGKLKAATFDDYYRALDDFSAGVGLGGDPADLQPDDFRAVRAAWDDRMGPWALDRHVQAVRTMFRWAVDVARLLDRVPWYGDQFGKSTEADKRLVTREGERERGQRRFTADELRIILAEATGPIRAMVLLALNGAMYATDIARLLLTDIRKEESTWLIDIDRGKTGGVPWKFPLWRETKVALDKVIAERPEPRDPAHAGLLFLTVRGNPWHRENVHEANGAIARVTETHAIGQEFDKILDRERNGGRTIRRKGVGFGSLRHTAISAIGEHPDAHARHRVTGHKVVGIQFKHYDKLSIERLKAVTDLARRKLLLPAVRRTGASSRPAPSPTPAAPRARLSSPAAAATP